MKLLAPSIAALTLSAASLSAVASLKFADVYGEPAQASSRERAIISAVANRTIGIDGKTKWVNLTHYDVIRFVSGDREFTWYFDGLAQPGPLDLREFAPAGFVDHRVTVYVLPSALDLGG
jgi:hypothetical protein